MAVLFAIDFVGIFAAVLVVYAYNPWLSWTMGRPYQAHNWEHILVNFGPMYLIMLLLCGFLTWYMYQLLWSRNATNPESTDLKVHPGSDDDNA